MTRKNPSNKPLRIVRNLVDEEVLEWLRSTASNYGIVLSNLAIAQSNLVRVGKDSAMPHFIAIVKELEAVYGFKFEVIEE